MSRMDGTQERRPKISIVGLGYVGLPLALLVAKKGFDVTGIDLNTDKVSRINDRRDPIGDEYVARHIVDTGLRATTSPTSISQAKVVIVCVPTTVKNGSQPD